MDYPTFTLSRLYELGVQSDIPLAGLYDAHLSASSCDVTIQRGTIDPNLAQVAYHRSYYGTPTGILMRSGNLASYHITHGQHITVDTHLDNTHWLLQQELAIYGMGIILLQRKVSLLHGNAVLFPQGAIAFLGQSGSGKSSLAGMFWRRGYRIFSDDLVPVTLIDEQAHVLPTFPRIKVLSEVVPQLALDESTLQIADLYPRKYSIPLGEQFADTPSPLKTLVVITPQDIAQPVLEAVNSLQKLQLLQAQLHLKPLLKHVPHAIDRLQTLIRLSQTATVYHFLRPFRFSLADTTSWLEAHLG